MFTEMGRSILEYKGDRIEDFERIVRIKGNNFGWISKILIVLFIVLVVGMFLIKNEKWAKYRRKIIGISSNKNL